jgi:hypothetical protein
MVLSGFQLGMTVGVGRTVYLTFISDPHIVPGGKWPIKIDYKKPTDLEKRLEALWIADQR